MRKFLMIMVLIISLGGCKSTKSHVVAEENQQKETQTDLQETVELRANKQSNDVIAEAETRLDSIATSVVIVKWSEPDTTGKQYPVETAHINKVQTSRSDADKKQQTTESIKTDVDKETKDESVETTTTKSRRNEKKESEVKSPRLLRWGGVVLIVLLVFFGLLRFGRYF